MVSRMPSFAASALRGASAMGCSRVRTDDTVTAAPSRRGVVNHGVTFGRDRGWLNIEEPWLTVR